MSEAIEYVICVTREELPVPVPGSTEEGCSICGATLWIAPQTRQDTKAPAICSVCLMGKLRDEEKRKQQ